jgi:MFS family permease
MATSEVPMASVTPTEPPKSLAFKISFACLSACNFLSALDAVIVASALPVISHALNATSSEAYWCGTGFLFAQAVSQPIYGAFCEVFGKKYSLLFSLALFTISSLFCAVAQSITWLIAARVVSTTLLQHVTQRTRRND